MPKRRHRERGASAVEMALVLPVLLLIIGGIIDFGRFFMVNAMLTNAAAEGTRYAVVLDDPASNSAAIESRAESAAVNVQGMAASATGANAAYTGDCDAGAVDMRVTVTIPFKWLLLNALPGITNPKTLSGGSVIGC